MRLLKFLPLLFVVASCGQPEVKIDVQDRERQKAIESLRKDIQSHSDTTQKLVEAYAQMEKMIDERLEKQYERLREIDRREVELEFREKALENAN